MYSVTAASRISGVHPETLRAWERRYELIQPRRDARGRRMYAAADIDRLRLLRRGTELGHPISRLAGLSQEELRCVCDACPPAEDRTGDLHRLVTRLLDAVARFRGDECDQILGLAATLLDPEVLVEKVVAPAMRAVGEHWHRGQMCTAQERLLSASARRTLGSLIATSRRRATGPVVVLATLPGEHHDIGLMATALLAAAEGLDCIYLGPDIPVADLVAATQATGARGVALSCVTQAADIGLQAAVTQLCLQLPPQCELWLGGAAAVDLDRAGLPARCYCVLEPDELRERARNLRA
jgi:DNA-binding transcriptional MerR regulator/methylmalonyl-CoA mutase cobalamin-binding subunit